ncbi:MAG: hypothetical protein HF967_08245 [Methanosarcinales archaeon]|nr:hypothetical protein [Methanosarcinales archaeon]
MTDLNYNEIEKLRYLLSKARNNQTSENDLKSIVHLINKSGISKEHEITNLLNEAGFSSLHELSNKLQEKKSEEFVKTLVAIGLAILVGYALLKILAEKRCDNKDNFEKSLKMNENATKMHA